jgi:hypothetical protein
MPTLAARGIGIFQDTDRQGGKERRRTVRWDDPAILGCGPARGVLGGEDAIGDSDSEIPDSRTN